MGAFSKEFWITIAVSIPVILWVLMIAQSRGQGITVPAIQFIVLIVGVTIIWREGERISEAVTRVWEKIDPTRVWDSEPRAAQNVGAGEIEKQMPTQTLRYVTEAPSGPNPPQERGSASNVFCLYCGYGIATDATFCRRCGRKQQSK